MSSVVISGDTSGSITLSAPAVAGTNTITLPASAGTVALTNSMGVQQADQWCLTADFTVNNLEQIINSNLSRVSNFTQVGTGMTQSSGVFTFPATGTYLIQYNISGYTSSGSTSYNNAMYIYLTTNNSSYSDIARSAFNLTASGNLMRYGGYASTMVTITDTTQQKVRFSVYMSGIMTVQGAGAASNTCGFNFIKLA
jgi:hypothetical protein